MTARAPLSTTSGPRMLLRVSIGAQRHERLDSHCSTRILRHTFSSHLAMRGAAPRAIQEPAGHQDLSTTQRYMHLSHASIRSAIDLLEQPAPHGNRRRAVSVGKLKGPHASEVE